MAHPIVLFPVAALAPSPRRLQCRGAVPPAVPRQLCRLHGGPPGAEGVLWARADREHAVSRYSRACQPCPDPLLPISHTHPSGTVQFLAPRGSLNAGTDAPVTVTAQAQSQHRHSHSTVTAPSQSQHRHSTATAQPQHSGLNGGPDAPRGAAPATFTVTSL